MAARISTSSSNLSDAGRILFDVSSSVRWTGPPVGIVRVESELALWALGHLPRVQFVFFDPIRMAYCDMLCDARPFLTGEAAVTGLRSAATPPKRRTDLIPPALRSAFRWIGQFRRTALERLERARLTSSRPWAVRLAERLQRRLMSRKYRDIMLRENGERRAIVPLDMVAGAPVIFRPDDTLVCAGFGWAHSNIDTIIECKRSAGFRFVLLCHDIIPLLYPHFYREQDSALFGNYLRKALAAADLVVTNSQKSETDCRAYCLQHGIAVRSIVRSPLGFDVRHSQAGSAAALPAGLQKGRFVLFVSTIEPRKGHRLLHTVWRRLASEGLPQSTGFKLVFVGRPGWMVDDLLSDLRRDQAALGICLISDASDTLLAALYEAAAFCVYPSVYEGYGLPVIEALAHGKALLASTGGGVPELVQDLSPCLDPADQEAWYRALKSWIGNPQARAPFEQAIRIRFRHPTWAEAAQQFFARVDPAVGEN